jgi:hypothetical protein
VVEQGESLQSISTEKYGTPKLWRALAAANSGLDKVREVREGIELLVPDPRHPLAIIERVTGIPDESLSALRQAQTIGMEGPERSFMPSLGAFGR